MAVDKHNYLIIYFIVHCNTEYRIAGNSCVSNNVLFSSHTSFSLFFLYFYDKLDTELPKHAKLETFI